MLLRLKHQRTRYFTDITLKMRVERWMVDPIDDDHPVVPSGFNRILSMTIIGLLRFFQKFKISVRTSLLSRSTLGSMKVGTFSRIFPPPKMCLVKNSHRICEEIKLARSLGLVCFFHVFPVCAINCIKSLVDLYVSGSLSIPVVVRLCLRQSFFSVFAPCSHLSCGFSSQNCFALATSAHHQ